ncbi:hypothetical protein Trydic_g21481 [Trypoxylus dichotomus]
MELELHGLNADNEAANSKRRNLLLSKNHIAKVCITNKRACIKSPKHDQRRDYTSARHVRDNDTTHDVGCSSDSCTNTLNIRNLSSVNKIMISANINDYECEMLYDPGAAHSVVGQDLWMRIGGPTLSKTRNLVAYTDVEIDTIGVTEVNIHAFGLVKKLFVYVKRSNDVPLFGLDWCIAINLPRPPAAGLCQFKMDI